MCLYVFNCKYAAHKPQQHSETSKSKEQDNIQTQKGKNVI